MVTRNIACMLVAAIAIPGFSEDRQAIPVVAVVDQSTPYPVAKKEPTDSGSGRPGVVTLVSRSNSVVPIVTNRPVVSFADPIQPTSSSWGASQLGCAGAGCDDGTCGLGCDGPACDDAGHCGHGLSQFAGCSRCRQRQCCCPSWRVAASVMFLRRRNESGPDNLIVNQNDNSQSFLNTSDLDDDYAAIPRLQIIRQFANCDGIGVNMFGLVPIESSEVSGGVDSPQVTAPGFPILSSAPGTLIRTDYETELNSIEVNYRRYYNDCLTFVAGYRWLQLSDYMNVTQTAPTVADLYSVDTDNQLHGFQIGMDAMLYKPTGKLSLNGMLRAGVFGNSAENDIYAPTVSGLPGLFVDRLASEGDNTAFFGELGFVGSYCVNNRLSLQGGYQLMWLEGVALAPDQVAVNDLIFPGTAALDNSGSLFLSGATVGLTYCF